MAKKQILTPCTIRLVRSRKNRLVARVVPGGSTSSSSNLLICSEAMRHAAGGVITPPRSCRPLRYHMRVPWKLSTQDVDHATAVTDTVVMPTQKQQRALTQSTRR